MGHFSALSEGCSVLQALDNRSSIPSGGRDFSLRYRVQTRSETHPASYEMGTTGSFPRDKAAGARN